jgi:hypothetical protein
MPFEHEFIALTEIDKSFLMAEYLTLAGKAIRKA